MLLPSLRTVGQHNIVLGLAQPLPQKLLIRFRFHLVACMRAVLAIKALGLLNYCSLLLSERLRVSPRPTSRRCLFLAKYACLVFAGSHAVARIVRLSLDQNYISICLSRSTLSTSGPRR